MKTYRENWSAMWRHISTWVVIATTCGAEYWTQMTPAEQQAVLDLSPWLKGAAPFLAFLAFAIAKGIPQQPHAEPDAPKTPPGGR